MKEKILIHLVESSQSGDGYEAPEEATQDGIARAVGIRVQHASQYVRPLVQEGLLEEALSHVRGGVRRRKAYFLTTGGRTKATTLRTDLLERPVAVRGKDGMVLTIPLALILERGRRRPPLLSLVRELEAKAFVDEASLQAPPVFVDQSGAAATMDAFYGREQELAELLQAIERAPVVVVTGVAGMGKTALGSKVCERLRGTRSLYWRRVRPWDTPLDLAVGLASFLDAAGRTALSSYLATAEAKQLGRFEELLAVDFADLKSLVVLDDVHTASRAAEVFLHCLKEALSKVRGASLLLLSRTVPRIYGREEAEAGGPVVELPLAGIKPEGVQEFLAQVPPADAAWVVKVAGGNPLFLRILARAGRTGSLERARYTIDRFIAEEIEIELTDDERDCLRLASLYEVPVPPAGLLLASPQGMPVAARLLRRGLLDQTEEGRLILHDFLRHYFQSTLPVNAHDRLLVQAVGWLAEGARLAEGEGNLPGAIALLANATMIDRDRSRRGRVLEDLARLRFLAGDLPGAIQAARDGLALAEDPEARARLHLQLSNALYPFHKDDEAEREADRGLELMPTRPSLLTAWLHFMKGKGVFDKRDFGRAREEFELALSWTPNLPEDHELLGQLLEWRGVLFLYDPARRDLALSESSYRASLEVRGGIGSRWLTRSYEGLALVALQTGRIEEALSYLDRARACYEHQRNPPVARNLEFLRGWALAECIGDYEAAEWQYREAAEVADSAYERYRLVWFDRFFADLYSHQGRHAEAKDSLERFLRAARGVMTDENEIQNLALMCRICIHAGDLAVARFHLDEARRLAGDHRFDAAAYYVGWAEGVFRTAQADLAGARSCFENILPLQPPGRTGTHIQEHMASGALRGEMLLDYSRLLAAEGRRDLSEAAAKEARDEFLYFGRKPLLQVADRALGAHSQAGPRIKQ